MELKSRVNSPALWGGGGGDEGAAAAGGRGGAGGTTGGAGGGAGGAAGVCGATGAIGCVIAMVAPAAEGGGAAAGDGGGATFHTPPLPARIGCVAPTRGAGSSGRRIVTLICFPPGAAADPPDECDEIQTSNDSKP